MSDEAGEQNMQGKDLCCESVGECGEVMSGGLRDGLGTQTESSGAGDLGGIKEPAPCSETRNECTGPSVERIPKANGELAGAATIASDVHSQVPLMRVEVASTPPESATPTDAPHPALAKIVGEPFADDLAPCDSIGSHVKPVVRGPNEPNAAQVQSTTTAMPPEHDSPLSVSSSSNALGEGPRNSEVCVTRESCGPQGMPKTAADPSTDRIDTSEGIREPQQKRPLKQVKTREVRPARREQRVFPVPTLRHFQSTQRVPQVLEGLVNKALSENRLLDHILLHGLPGCGSAVVAQALTREYAPKRCVEFDALEGCTTRKLSRAIETVSGGGVLLIRHIEVLDASCDVMLSEALGMGEPSVGVNPVSGSSTDTESGSIDERIARSARQNLGGANQRLRRKCDFTLIGTAHYVTRIGYRVRTRFDQMIHLRKDPRGLRAAVVMAAAREGIHMTSDAYPVLERFLRTTDDCAEQVVHALVMRAEIECVKVIDAQLATSVITEDLPSRIADEIYAAALQRHMGGRRVTEVTDEEVDRINQETGWGESAVRGALFLVIHEDRQKRSNAA